MSHLIPEKRADKNGKLVTKHVRAAPQQASGKSIPAPSAVAAKASKKTFKPRPKQTEQNYHSFRLGHYKADPPLRSQEMKERYEYSMHAGEFKASDVEIYAVLSATTSVGNAIELLVMGARSAETARDYLRMRDADNLIDDRSGIVNEALERGINAEGFIASYSNISKEEKDSPYLLDLIEFRQSALSYSWNNFLESDILSGEVALSDLKAIGFSRLKPHGRGYELTDLLKRLNAGEADYTVDDLKAFVIRSADAKTDQETFSHACKFAYRKGFELLQNKEGFEAVHQEHMHYLSPTSSWRRNNENEEETVTYDRVEYGARMRLAISGKAYWFSGSSTPYFEAGIPVEVAIDTVNGGGGIREAQAINDGISSSVAGGWL